MKKKLYWKELTDDGLLKDPAELGPYYSKESISSWDGFDSEDEAVKKLAEMKEAYKFDVRGNYILVTIYSP